MGLAERRHARLPQPRRLRQILPEQGRLRTAQGAGEGTEKVCRKRHPPKTKNKDKKKKDDKKDSNTDEKDDQPKDIVVELRGIEDRVVRLTPNSSDMGSTIISKDGETLYYLAAFEGGYDLWKMNLRKKETRLLHKMDAGWADMQPGQGRQEPLPAG